MANHKKNQSESRSNNRSKNNVNKNSSSKKRANSTTKKYSSVNEEKSSVNLLVILLAFFICAFVSVFALYGDELLGYSGDNKNTESTASTTAAADTPMIVVTDSMADSSDTTSDTEQTAATDVPQKEFDIYREEFENNSYFALKYPILKFGSESEENAVKNIFINVAKGRFRRDIPNPNSQIKDGLSFTYEIFGYTVSYSSEKLLSVVFSGKYRYDNGKTTPYDSNVSFAVNVDLDSFRMIESRTLWRDLKSFSKDLTDKKLAIDAGNAVDYSLSDIISSYSELYVIYPDVYFDGSSAFVILEIAGSNGGYITATVENTDLGKYFNISYLS